MSRHAYWLAMQAAKPVDQMRDYSLRNDLGARAWDVFCTANFFNFVPWVAAIEYLGISPSPWNEPQKRLRDRLQARDNNVLDVVKKGESLSLDSGSQPPWAHQRSLHPERSCSVSRRQSADGVSLG
jgi:hypothetical protein